VMLVLALAGIALNIIFREKFFTGIVDLAIGAAGALIYMVTHSFHYSTNYLYEMLFFSVTIVMGVIILVEILLGKKKEEEAEPVKSNW
ncbi:MAG: hypothetical protein CW338_06180, partial [Clostridiales bacterium]|nr:hypothetical protein [Clostridiales bacterium]